MFVSIHSSVRLLHLQLTPTIDRHTQQMWDGSQTIITTASWNKHSAHNASPSYEAQRAQSSAIPNVALGVGVPFHICRNCPSSVGRYLSMIYVVHVDIRVCHDTVHKYILTKGTKNPLWKQQRPPMEKKVFFTMPPSKLSKIKLKSTKIKASKSISKKYQGWNS